MFSGVSKFSSLSFALISLLFSLTISAQVTPTIKGVSTDDFAPKWDIFLGYSYLSPHGTVNTILTRTPVTGSYNAVNVGGVFSGTYFFNTHLGVQAELGFHEFGVQEGYTQKGTKDNNDGFTTAAAGLVWRYPTGTWTPFLHALGGTADVDGPVHNGPAWGPDVTAGGGLDVHTPLFSHHLSIRVVQADYEYMHANFGTGNLGGKADINAIRLSTGIVWHSSNAPSRTPVALACLLTPTTVYSGDPITVTLAADNLNPKQNAVYSWTSNGATGNDQSTTVPTAGLAPGTYTVNATVREGKRGKEGARAGQSAEATAVFTVKKFDPPTTGCFASPVTIKPGETSALTTNAVSPQNRPLTFTYTATAGSVSGTGSTATYNPKNRSDVTEVSLFRGVFVVGAG